MRYVEGLRVQFTHPIRLDPLLHSRTHTTCRLHWPSEYQVHIIVGREQTHERNKILGAHTGGSIEEGDGVAGKAGIVQIQSV